MGLFSRSKKDEAPALREMPVAPGVGKVRAHAAPGAVKIRYDTVRGLQPESLFDWMLGVGASTAEDLSQLAWAKGEKFRVYTPEKPAGAPDGGAAPERVVKRLDIGERVSILAVEAEAGGKLGRAMPLYWTDLTHTCEPNWAKRFSDHLAAWVEGNVDSPNGSEPMGFQALDFAWHRAVYLRGAAMPLEIAAVAIKAGAVPPPKKESVKSVVHPGGRASDPDEFDLEGTILAVQEAKVEGGSGTILKLQVGPIERHWRALP